MHVNSEAAVFFRLNRVTVSSEAELLIFIITAKCKFTREEKASHYTSPQERKLPQ